MLNAIVTEIPQQLEPTTEDSFVYVAVTDRPRETTRAPDRRAVRRRARPPPIVD